MRSRKGRSASLSRRLLIAAGAMIAIGLVGIFAVGDPPKKRAEVDFLVFVQLGVGFVLAGVLNIALARGEDAKKFERDIVRDELRSCLELMDEIEIEFHLAVGAISPDLAKVSEGIRRLRAKLREGRDFCEVCDLVEARRGADELLHSGVRSVSEALSAAVDVTLSEPDRRVSTIASAAQTIAAFRRQVLVLIVSANRQNG